jgi:mannitol/fructose-specific phosphotransferase system IIA component (Ntr-type)
MSFLSLFKPQGVLLDMQASDSDGALAELASAHVELFPNLSSRKDEICDALCQRESQGSTGASRVALPHIKLDGIDEVSVVVGIHRGGIDFNSLDGENIHVFFSILRPSESADQHLDLLRWIASLAQHPDFVSFACQAQDASQVIDLLAELAD